MHAMTVTSSFLPSALHDRTLLSSPSRPDRSGGLGRAPLRHALLFIAAGALCISAAAQNHAKKPRTRVAGTAASAAPAAPAASYYASRADVLAFADDVAARRGLDAGWLRSTLGQARFLPQVPRLMLPPTRGTPKNWAAYRDRFIDPVRVGAGVRFWQEHAQALERAEREYGVSADIIVGIIGVETLYGRHMGNFRVLDALATLAFDFPDAHPRAEARRAYFRGELEQFLGLAERGGTDPTTPRGSYAGAQGLGQFMPSSLARWAVDFDHDGHIDLHDSPEDAIGSVANYFIAHGWTPGMATHYRVLIDPAGADMATLMAPDILPTFSAERMAELGVAVLGAGAQHSGPLALVELQNGDAPPSYVAGTQNFYAVTRYNWSSYYAMAVIELGREVAEARGR